MEPTTRGTVCSRVMSKPVDEGFLPGIQTLGDRPSRCNRGRWAVSYRDHRLHNPTARGLLSHIKRVRGRGRSDNVDILTPSRASERTDRSRWIDEGCDGCNLRNRWVEISWFSKSPSMATSFYLRNSSKLPFLFPVLECGVGVAWSFRTSASSERCIPMAHAIVAVAKLLRRSNEAVEWAASSLDTIDRPAWRTSPRSRPLISEKAF
ncbi:hypothetical protein GW17_00044068 [Ensete ventricosum]|nr:hypothetical protein GW17_00044068 [Ensete ventricosum]